MKKIFPIAFLFFNLISFSQIKVIKTVPLERLGRASSTVYIQKEGDEYTLFYKNIENGEDTSGYRKFGFKDLNDDYANFYKIIDEGFSASPLYDIKLELPNDFVWLHYVRNPKEITVQFMTSNKVSSVAGISEFLTRAQITKLFEKQ